MVAKSIAKIYTNNIIHKPTDYRTRSISSSSLLILSVQIWTHSAQPRWTLGSDKSYSL